MGGGGGSGGGVLRWWRLMMVPMRLGDEKNGYVPTIGPTDRQTERPTDRPSNRDAWTHLKTATIHASNLWYLLSEFLFAPFCCLWVVFSCHYCDNYYVV